MAASTATLFLDTDECIIGFKAYGHNCSEELGICTNTIGGYNCTCKPGYIGDGRNCTGRIYYAKMNSVICDVL